MGNIYFAWSYHIYLTYHLPTWFDGKVGNFVGIFILKELE